LEAAAPAASRAPSIFGAEAAVVANGASGDPGFCLARKREGFCAAPLE